MTDVSDLFSDAAADWVESHTSPAFREKLESSPQAMKAIFAVLGPDTGPNAAPNTFRTDVGDEGSGVGPGDGPEGIADGDLVIDGASFDELLEIIDFSQNVDPDFDIDFGIDDDIDDELDGGLDDETAAEFEAGGLITGAWVSPASLGDVLDIAATPIVTLVTMSASGSPELVAAPTAAIEGFWAESNLLLAGMLHMVATSNGDNEEGRGWSKETVSEVCEDIADTWGDEIQFWPELIDSIMGKISRGEQGWARNELVDARAWGLHAAAILASLMSGWPNVDTWRVLIDALDHLKIVDCEGNNIYTGREAALEEE